MTLTVPQLAYAKHADSDDAREATDGEEPFRRFELEYELDAYYSNIGLYVALTKAPIPHLGAQKESNIYSYLLSRALVPRFLVIEASVNPLPYLGVYIKKNDRSFYDNMQITENFNLVTAVTAGFQEPYAASIFAGNVVDFDVPNRTDVTGKGYTGYLVSAGNYHIKDNELVKDEWWEFEWKIKGDRKSTNRKLSWSFRVGLKLHGHPEITDIVYLSLRRSRIDYNPIVTTFYHNSGFEYTFDMKRRSFDGIRHYFTVDKKWPLKNKKIALALAVGFVWESAKKYTGALGADRAGNTIEYILRPNIEF
ncbi:MAG TPA: hypothetical protein DCO77_05895 [Nitrospiraceae bacterium]|nr:hypothetical protein [Nitrospiraceae bacterium]